MRKIDSITIETSSVCNARCIICPNNNTVRKNHHTLLTDLAKILYAFADVKSVVLCGMYEPLCDPRLDQILTLIEDTLPGVKITIFTNAMMLNKETARIILDHNVTSLVCSVHGYSKKTYEKVMQGLDRDRVYRNIRRLLLLRGESKKPKISVSFVRNKHNIKELTEFREYWTGKVDEVSDYELSTWMGKIPQSLADKQPKGIRACPMYEWPIVIDCFGNVVRCCYEFTHNYGHVLKGGLERWKQKTWISNTYPAEGCEKCNGWTYP